MSATYRRVCEEAGNCCLVGQVCDAAWCMMCTQKRNVSPRALDWELLKMGPTLVMSGRHDQGLSGCEGKGLLESVERDGGPISRVQSLDGTQAGPLLLRLDPAVREQMSVGLE